MSARSAAFATANQLPHRSSRRLTARSGSRASAWPSGGARAGVGVGEACDLARARLGAAAEVERPLPAQRDRTVAELRGVTDELAHEGRGLAHAIERQDGA